MFFNGKSVYREYIMAEILIRSSAETMNDPGDMYIYGKGTEENKEKEAERYRITAGQGERNSSEKS